MSAMRELDQEDFDLERIIDLFDEALTSKDPRVVETLRKLMMIVTLTKPETSGPAIDRNAGPLRKLHKDINRLWNRLGQMEDELRQMHQQLSKYEDPNWVQRSGSWPNMQPYTTSQTQSIDEKAWQQMMTKINSPGLYDK